MKTGLYFGSFNPIHIGHLVIANFMIEFTDLKQLWFVVSPQNPLKEKRSLLKDYHRLEMVRLAVAVVGRTGSGKTTRYGGIQNGLTLLQAFQCLCFSQVFQKLLR